MSVGEVVDDVLGMMLAIVFTIFMKIITFGRFKKIE